MEPFERLAAGHELQALQLERFIKAYVPQGWQEPIGKVMSGFSFSAQDVAEMEIAHRNGTLRDMLEQQHRNPHVLQATLDFFATR
jgi:hypothetical protein